MTLGTGTDEFLVHGRQIYWRRRKEPGRPIEKIVHHPFTIRGANTLQNTRLAGLVPVA